ncbi:sugar ABC transporter substrate-binding protein [Streptomyces sporangiiformans]|uniref:Sugar ABC transporter substrate-binding protein n=1 Tax=Streptomyces sporangiiformans TaxID=2315329 RepID=A0A505DQF6_9ACTN|nr:substrate-binding domain-containing protein [Streptomyces sporangiiformans]TPQ23433.1 sugar ABC transporter substrate-binding protein [Streptomyces sporangiiformans]
MALSLAGCGDNGGSGESDGGFTVGLLLPSRAVPRWEHSDKPLIEKRVKELCPDCRLEYANAENDAGNQRQQMNSMITKGVEVLIVDAADTKALRSSIQDARDEGVPVVSYDRLAEGPISSFVSFDGAQVGRLQGEALLTAMGDKADDGQIVMLNGDPASPNAAWYRDGAMSVLENKVKIGKSYTTLGWRAENAHDNMSAAISALGPQRIDGVLAANDTIATGVISALKSARVTPLPPVTGQDADLNAVRRIVKGEQYMTVYKPFTTEADSAAAMAIALGRGNDVGSITTTTVDNATDDDIPAVLLTPIAVTVDNIEETLVRDGVYTIDEICTPKLRPACDEAGLTP